MKRNSIKFGKDGEARRKIQKDFLLEQIKTAYEKKGESFCRSNDVYGDMLFKKTLEEWRNVPLQNMRAWIKTHKQAAQRRAGGNFIFDLGEYFQFEQVARIDENLDV